MAARGSAVTHVSAIMRVRKDELISIFAGCLSPAAGRGDTGPLALPLTVGLRSYGRAGGTLEDGDVGQQPAHHANLDPREAGWGPTCDHLFSVARPHARRTPSTDGAFPRAAVRARQRAGDTGAHAPIRPGGIPRVACKRMPAVSPESTGPACYGG